MIYINPVRGEKHELKTWQQLIHIIYTICLEPFELLSIVVLCRRYKCKKKNNIKKYNLKKKNMVKVKGTYLLPRRDGWYAQEQEETIIYHIP